MSFNADYVNWFDLDRQYINLIRVKSNRELEQEFRETSPFFHTAAIAGYVKDPLAREYGTAVFLFVGAKVDINERIKSEIAEVKL